MTRDILFTFDYELFLGQKSGSVKKCLIDPTAQLTKLLNEHNLKGMFFVDTTYLCKLKAQNNRKTNDDFITITKQLKELLLEGHYIFPHIHPHWLDATYDEKKNEWNLSSLDKYRFHSLSKDEKDTVFLESIEILNSICKSVIPSYQIDSYRAGGWSIQPFSDFKSYFLKYKITKDFSVLRGGVCYSNAQQFDYRNAPDLDIYKFNDNVLHPVKDGGFTEYIISSIDIPKNDILNKLLLKYLWKTNDRGFGDGLGANPVSQNSNYQHTEMISIDLLTHFRLEQYYSYLNKNSFMQFISHPKMVTNHSLGCFKKFLKKSSSQYVINSDYRLL